ncbi:MAG: DegV family protein [Lachnospiraceae bacterium]|nr:DegV family protein [Lachnospiraceae bacterium]MDD7027176.1 DegV family protein [Lachnospiraceae bacterium]MDY5700587.1 DegV family protein [Lachnospiraceae bacterium]
MRKVAIMTDSNSGITQQEGKELGIAILPMPFIMDGETYFEDITLTQEDFYKKLMDNSDISTSQPSPESVTEMFDSLLKEYDEVVHIPMSSGLSGSCQTANMLAQDYEGKVQVVNNQRISVTQRQSVMDAIALAKAGKTAAEIKEILEKDKLNSSIYIMLDTLYYLKKGGRITPAAAALGTILKLKPVLTIQGDKLDAFAKARTSSQGKKMMINAIRNDIETRFGGKDNVYIQLAYTYDKEAALRFKEEVLQEFPGSQIVMLPLSLSVACHIGPGALAVACTQILPAV